jgi:predicted DNA-binding transcriptional regulator AlpA
MRIIMKKYLMAKDVIKRLGISRDTLYRWHKCGKFVPEKRELYSKVRLYSEEQVEKFLEERESES